MNRRQFLVLTGVGSVTALIESACKSARQSDPPANRANENLNRRPETPEKARPPVARPAPFPVVKASGSPFDLGQAIGKATRKQIDTLLKRRSKWFKELKGFALSDRKARIDGFAAAIQKHHPEVMAELRGLARGAGRSLDEIMVLNLQPELAGLKERSSCGECSTFHLVDQNRILLLHNEDDHDANRDLMYLIRARPKDRPAFVSLAYPGVIPGNVPAITSAGIVRTTNYIGASEVRVGVPRYVLGRALLDAKTVEAGLGILTNKEGAYSFHVNLGSEKERKLVSIEIGPGGIHDVRQTRNEIYIHTNHYILPKMKKVPEISAYVGGSSQSRFQVLKKALGSLPKLPEVKLSNLARLLSSHQAVTQPYSPCRHPKGKVKGRTVATAMFDVLAPTFTLLEGNPCEGRKRTVPSI